MKKLDQILIISIIGVVISWSLGYSLSGFQSPLRWLYDWLLDLSLLIGYPGSFVMSFLGNATIVFPFPYLIVPFVLGGLVDESTVHLFDPLIVGVVSGLGATLGEMTGYLLGYIGGESVEGQKTSEFRNYIEQHPEYTPLIIWFLAVTPIPDDPVIVPLGMAKYSWWRVFLPCFIGKSIFLVGVSWAGRLGLEWVSMLLTSGSTLQSGLIELLSVILLLVVVYLILRKDWSSQSS